MFFVWSTKNSLKHSMKMFKGTIFKAIVGQENKFLKVRLPLKALVGETCVISWSNVPWGLGVAFLRRREVGRSGTDRRHKLQIEIIFVVKIRDICSTGSKTLRMWKKSSQSTRQCLIKSIFANNYSPSSGCLRCLADPFRRAPLTMGALVAHAGKAHITLWKGNSRRRREHYVHKQTQV